MPADIPPIRLVDMKSFSVLARTRHFGRTANEMGTTQPAISARLAALEQALGCQLVLRGDRDFALTAEGERVLAMFEETLEKFAALRQELASAGVSPAATIRIGAIDSIAATWLPDLVEQLSARFAGLRLELSVGSTNRLVDGMARGEFDLIFALDPVIDERFRSFISCTLEMIWVASPAILDKRASYSPNALAEMPIITFPIASPPFRHISSYFNSERVLASKLTSSNSLYAIVNLLIDGFGIGAIPTVTVRRELEQGLLTPMPTEKALAPMQIVATYQTRTHQSLMAQVIEQARASAANFCAGLPQPWAWVNLREEMERVKGIEPSS